MLISKPIVPLENRVFGEVANQVKMKSSGRALMTGVLIERRHLNIDTHRKKAKES